MPMLGGMMCFQISHRNFPQWGAVDGLGKWDEREGGVHCQERLDVGEAELRERGKMKELTQNEAHNVSTNLVHWGEKQRGRENGHAKHLKLMLASYKYFQQTTDNSDTSM